MDESTEKLIQAMAKEQVAALAEMHLRISVLKQAIDRAVEHIDQLQGGEARHILKSAMVVVSYREKRYGTYAPAGENQKPD